MCDCLSSCRISPPVAHSYHVVENIHDVSDISCVNSPLLSLADNTPAASPSYNYGATLPANSLKGRDMTFAFTRDGDALPRDERRRRLRQRRPHSALAHSDVPQIVYPEDDIHWVNGEGRTEPGYKRACRQPQRPVSMLDHLSGDSFRSQASSDFGRPQHWSQATSQESLNTLGSHAHSESMANARRAAGQSRNSYIVDYNTMPARTSVGVDHKARQAGYPSPGLADLLHQSMPRLNQDYGVFGDNDDNEVDDSMYPPADSASRLGQVPHISVTQARSKSHGDGLHRDSQLDVSQNQLNLALARSLAEDQHNGIPRKASTPYIDPRTRIGPSSRRAVHPAPLFRPKRLKDNLWEEPSRPGDISSADSTLNESTATIGRGKDGRKKKDKQKKNQMDTSSIMDISTTDGGKEKKKTFSFKSIFFRKR